MNLANVWCVYRKDLVDVFRDRRTVIAMVLVPLVLYPSIVILGFQAVSFQEGKREAAKYTVAVADEAHQVWLQRVLDADAAKTDPDDVPETDSPSAAATDAPLGPRGRLTSSAIDPSQFEIVVTDAPLEASVRDGAHTLAVACEPPIGANGPAEEGDTRVSIYYDPTEFRSKDASGDLSTLLGRDKDRLVRARLAAAGLSPDALEPLAIRQVSTASAEKMGGFAVGTILPYFLILMAVSGAMNAATDLTVGERERGTLEALLTAPVPVTELLAGKFLVVTTVALLSSLLNLLSLAGTTAVAFSALQAAGSTEPILAIPYSAMPLALLMVVPLAMFFSAILIATCSFAKTLKEAYLYLTPVMLVSLLPAMASFMPSIELNGVILITPIANVVVLIRELFLGHYDWPATVLTFAITCFYATAAIAVAARLFGQEAVVFSDASSYKTLLLRRFYRPSPYPGAALALTLVAILFPLNVYWQSFFANRLAFALASSLIGFFLLLPLGLAWYLKFDLRSTFSLRPASGRNLALAVVIGLACVAISSSIGYWQTRWFPPSPQAEELFERLARLIGEFPLGSTLLLVALAPAVCEEMLFRGWLLAGLRRRMGPLALCLTVGVLFGLFHLSFYRIFTTGLLGVILTFVCLRTDSIFPAMIVHFVNNASAIALSQLDDSAASAASLERLVPWLWIPAGLLLLTAAALMKQRERDSL